MDLKTNINCFADEASVDNNDATPMVDNQPSNTKKGKPKKDKTGNRTTFASWWKYLKWVLVLVLLGVFIWLIWYLSTPHYTTIKPTNIKYQDNQIVISTNNHEDYYKGKTSDMDADYYITAGDKTVYRFYEDTNHGEVAWQVTEEIVHESITTSNIPVTEYRLSSANWDLWYAISVGGDSTKKYYTYAFDNSEWSEVTDSDTLTLLQTLYGTTANAGVVSSSDIGYILLQLIPTIIIIALFIWYFSKISKLQGGTGEDSLWNVGKSQAKLAKSTIKFDDVAGLKEEKTELIEIVDYLKNPNRYVAMGARAPKGVILYGPPGTGKTLLAKAVAGEAKVPFFQATGSSFEDMLVGVGAKRVRDLFTNAKKSAPSIIFIDEFDSVAAKRGRYDIAGTSAGVADQTINQLLAEMDGFNTSSGVVIIAATNRLDVLDEAILRPGRFDRHVQINLPDIKEREAILKLHAKNKNISSSVELEDIARRTPGFSGAQLENVLNEATLLAVRENKTTVSMHDIDEAIDRVIAGPAKTSRVITEAEKKQIAFHEAGHALVGLNIPGSDVVEKITIIPRGVAAGYTLATPEKQELSIQKKSDLLAIIASTLGGRAAEEIKYGANAISTGAANDLYKVTNITRAMVTQLGMTELGLTQFVPSEGQQNPYSKNYSEQTAQKIDKEIENIIQKEYNHAKDILKKNWKELELIVTSLLVLETIVKKQIDYIHKNKALPQEVIDKQKQLDKENKEEKKIEVNSAKSNKKKTKTTN